MLAVFVPLKPIFPDADLPKPDQSAFFALNQAVAQGLVFGKDILLTYGPYASIWSQEYHPSTDHFMVWGSFFLCVCYSLLLFLLSRGVKFQWLLMIYGIYLACFVNHFLFGRDPLFSSYPLFLALLTYRLMLSDDHDGDCNISKPMAITLGILFMPLGLLSLIKGTFLLTSIVTSVLCFVIFWHGEKKSLAYASVIIPSVSTIFFWVISGQPFSALPYF